MKVVHSSKTKAPSLQGLSRDQAAKLAMQAERDNDITQATGIYHAMIKLHPSYEPAYTRLMIIYRKEKEYKKEIEIIDNAIEMFLSAYAKTSRLKVSSSITRLSTSLARATGLTDKKGKASFEPETVVKWRKRRAVAAAKLKKSKLN